MGRIYGIALAALVMFGGCGQTPAIDYAPPDEERLVLYTSHKAEVYGPIVKEFEERTGIWVQVETGGSVELLERIAAESEEVRCDLMFGGGVESLEAYKGLFAPYESPLMQEIYSEYRSGSHAWTPFSSLPVVLIYNPKLVTGSRPVGWNNLLEASWKGKIAFADPSVSGSGYTALATLLQALPLQPEETLRRFADNLDGQVLESSGEVVSAVADGSCYIGVTLEETALRGIAAGYDIAMAYPQEGTSAVPDGAAIVAGCAHEENARAFVDFILGSDVQCRLASDYYRRPVRSDMFVPERETQGFVLLNYDLDWASSSRGDILASWNTLLGEGNP